MKLKVIEQGEIKKVKSQNSKRINIIIITRYSLSHVTGYKYTLLS